jgi:hypothetical protein
VNRTLLLTGSTFNTFPQGNGLWPLANHLINFTGANLHTNATAGACLMIELGMHGAFLRGKQKA